MVSFFRSSGTQLSPKAPASAHLPPGAGKDALPAVGGVTAAGAGLLVQPLSLVCEGQSVCQVQPNAVARLLIQLRAALCECRADWAQQAIVAGQGLGACPAR